jgi:hypothetical protein
MRIWSIALQEVDASGPHYSDVFITAQRLYLNGYVTKRVYFGASIPLNVP